MDNEELEQELSDKIRFAAQAYRARGVPLEECHTRAKADIIAEHFVGTYLEGRGYIMREPKIDKSIECLNLFVKKLNSERELIARGLALGIFEEGTDAFNITTGHLLGYRQGFVQTPTSQGQKLMKGQPGVRFDRTLAELRLKPSDCNPLDLPNWYGPIF